MRGRIGIAAGVVALLAWPLPSAQGDSANGNDTAYAGSGSQHAEWHASDRSVRMWASPTIQMSTDRCMDAMLDWKPASGHYDSRVVRSCKPGAPIYTYGWSGDLVDDPANLDTSQVAWIEPLVDWNAANISETQKGYGYVIDDSTLDVLDQFTDGEEQFAGAGSPNYDSAPITCKSKWARVLTRYQNGTYKGCKNFPANSATS